MENQNVILLEFNELCPPLLDKFIAQGHLPNFAKLYSSSKAYTTDARCDVEYLEPWIQWVTLHTGLPFEKHKVFRLGQAQNLEHDSIWDILSKHGKDSWLCGSMNVRWDPKDNNILVLPDPWSIDVEASPKELQPFYHFVRANVQEHTNANHRLSLKDNLAFLGFMLKHGLSLSTVKRLAEIVIKQVTKADDRWKKATILDWLQFDVFAHVYKKHSPSFATFFSNSTAHFQHKFWRYMEPERFPMKPSQKEIDLYGDAILYAYKNHDALIGKVFDLAKPDTTIILSSALSQQPYTEKDAEGGKRFYRPHQMSILTEKFGLTGVEKISPVMSHQFHVICESEAAAAANYEALGAVTYDGEGLFSLRLEGKDVFGGCRIYQPVESNATIQVEGKDMAFSDVFYLADNLKSGMHHPHGVFWVYKASQTFEKPETLLPLEDTTHVILDECGVTAQ